MVNLINKQCQHKLMSINGHYTFKIPRSRKNNVLENAGSVKHSAFICSPLRLRHKPQNRHQATHQRTDNIEETEGQIHQSGYA